MPHEDFYDMYGIQAGYVKEQQQKQQTVKEPEPVIEGAGFKLPKSTLENPLFWALIGVGLLGLIIWKRGK